MNKEGRKDSKIDLVIFREAEDGTGDVIFEE